MRTFKFYRGTDDPRKIKSRMRKWLSEGGYSLSDIKDMIVHQTRGRCNSLIWQIYVETSVGSDIWNDYAKIINTFRSGLLPSQKHELHIY
jgi:hypothetical protein